MVTEHNSNAERAIHFSPHSERESAQYELKRVASEIIDSKKGKLLCWTFKNQFDAWVKIELDYDSPQTATQMQTGICPLILRLSSFPTEIAEIKLEIVPQKNSFNVEDEENSCYIGNPINFEDFVGIAARALEDGLNPKEAVHSFEEAVMQFSNDPDIDIGESASDWVGDRFNEYFAQQLIERRYL